MTRSSNGKKFMARTLKRKRTQAFDNMELQAELLCGGG